VVFYRPHQGFILKSKPLEFIEIDALDEPKAVNEHWLALDEVVDPQNFGALLRSAYFLGFKVRDGMPHRTEGPL
jgi:21S rRNA (GM2251-2'-O)-methyltransferase